MEDSLREFEQKVTELKTRAEGLQSDSPSKQELLKLQVTLFPDTVIIMRQRCKCICLTYEFLLLGCIRGVGAHGGLQAEQSEPRFVSEGSV